MKKYLLLLAIGSLFISVAAIGATGLPKFLKDDPVQVDHDNISIPKPTERPLSKTIDLLQKTFLKPKSGNVHAVDVNTLDEVPDSSWFTNRMGRRVMSIEELVRGPNQGDGPDLSQPVQVINAKTEGATPGLLIKDAKGQRFFFKFDPLYHPQMATSTEVVGTKFFHAFGYNVPENYLVYWNPKDYVIESKARVIWDSGKQEPLSRGYVENLLEIVPRRPDGAIQVLASKFLPGEPLGPYDYQGTRRDDPNDIYPHEDRRELRGLLVFFSWMNHNDSDSVNTLDMYYTDQEGRKFVKHSLIDFGTILGSGATLPHTRRVGNEYYIEFNPMFKALGTFGFWERDWHHVDFPNYNSIGRFESKRFIPELWKPDYPFPPGDKMDAEDSLWATRTVMRFSNEMIRAMVKVGKWEEPGAEDYLVQTLIERRDKIVHHYLSTINPLDQFEIVDSNLRFVNLGLEAGLSSDCGYYYEWFSFNNETRSSSPLAFRGTSHEPSISVPDAKTDFLMVKISSACAGQPPEWKNPVVVYFRSGSPIEIVGIERHKESP